MHSPAARERAPSVPGARSAAERTPRRPAGQRVAAHPGGQRVAQLAALASGGGKGVIQRWGTLPLPDPMLHSFQPAAVPAPTGFTPLPPTARRVVHKMFATTAPADPPGMAHWKGLGYLGDPAKHGAQALTRMHAIRGRFGGPSQANNMFLGTALSNNFSAQSHFKLVEQPLEGFLNGKTKGEVRAFDYRVSPNFGQVPGYMQARIDGAPAGPPNNTQAGLQAFAQASIPDGFNCDATLYRQMPGQPPYAIDLGTQPVSTTVGVAGPPAALPLPAPIPAAVGTALAPVAKAHATASESGALGALGYGALGTMAGSGLAAGYAAVAAHGVTGALAAGYTALTAGGLSGALAAGASLLSGPVGWTALGLGALGAIYGYATAEND